MGQEQVRDEIVKSDLDVLGRFSKADYCFSLCRSLLHYWPIVTTCN